MLWDTAKDSSKGHVSLVYTVKSQICNWPQTSSRLFMVKNWVISLFLANKVAALELYNQTTADRKYIKHKKP